MSAPQIQTTAIATGATGQDGYFLVSRLLAEGAAVHAVVRSGSDTADLHALSGQGNLNIHELDITDSDSYGRLIADVHPDEFYNFAGQSSVSRSFDEPTTTWRTNADAVQGLLESIRLYSPETRFYQSSSTDMFGSFPGGASIHDEESAFMPQSPYAAAKAAAHVLCDAYRRAFDLRIACGILSNHESRRRPPTFLTRKVVDHASHLRDALLAGQPPDRPLRVGNLAARRDWGFAPNYVDGIIRINRQITVRSAIAGAPAEVDAGRNYRDYILASGKLHSVWELIDHAFALAGLPLEWDRSSSDSAHWSATLRSTGAVAVIVEPALIRPSDPSAIGADASKACLQLGWQPQPGLDAFLRDMLDI